MRSTYKPEDITVLLKDITGLVEPLPTKEREKRIQSGVHYCEMLPIEYRPTPAYMEAYQAALKSCASETARAVASVSEKILASKGRTVVLVSLARAGASIGVLIKRYLKKKYGLDTPHYAVSIIRGRGIDHNAMKYLLDRYQPEQLQFVDGWIGKGAILKVLREALEDYPGVSGELAVLADPANMTALCGTHEDILVPSSCLNSTVSGLMSRTFLRDDIIGKEDFHGAVYYGELAAEDVTYDFIEAIECKFQLEEEALPVATDIEKGRKGLDEIKEIARLLQIEDINLIKPGIGETTRVLLRRVPWKILVGEAHREDPILRHIYRLAKEKQVEIVYWPLKNYRACGVIKNSADI